MLPLHSSLHYQQICSKKTLQLFAEVDRLKQYPSKWSHAAIFFISCGEETFELGTRITMLFINIGHLFHMPFKKINYKKPLTAFKIISILVLDPLSIICQVVILIVRVVSSLFGCLRPRIGLKGWYITEKVRELVLRLSTNIWKKMCATPPVTAIKNELTISPEGAYLYIGWKQALEIELQLKTAAHQQKLNTEIYQAATQLALLIFKHHPVICQELFNPIYLQHKDFRWLQTIAPLTGDVTGESFKQISKLKQNEVHSLVRMLINFTAGATNQLQNSVAKEEILKLKRAFDISFQESTGFSPVTFPDVP